MSNAIRTVPDSKMKSDKIRLEAQPIKRILDRKSHDVVGWLYEWNNGELIPMWKAKRFDDVVFDEHDGVQSDH